MLFSSTQFQKLLLRWFDRHGRKHLPWQQNKTPYRVWISEIMLQQTQVATVIDYYQRFMQHFPDIESLASATEDKVLHLWAGLGYYSRARNLHRAAKLVVEKLNGKFPETIEALTQLPGIGPSTAGAILALAFNQRATILDGNVKRVLARFHAISAPINELKIENQLWEIATHYTPTKRIADYTQAMMDLGATCCTRTSPQCFACPLASHCKAHQQNIAQQLPIKKATKTLSIRSATFFLLKKNQHVLLYKRPSTGIWGGLWSLPEIPGKPDLENLNLFYQQLFLNRIEDYQHLPAIRHTFTHYRLDMFPILIELKHRPKLADKEQIWYNPKKPVAIGLPKPIQRILHDSFNLLSKTEERIRRPRPSTITR